jgi:hypothetical protein
LLVVAVSAAAPLLGGGLRFAQISPAFELEPSTVLGAATRVTANVRAQPDSRGEVVAVLPAGRRPELLGRSEDGAWIAIAFGGEAPARGWVPADRLDLAAHARDALPVMAATAVSPLRDSGSEASGALPDLAFGAVFLTRDGRIALDIRNNGEGTIENVKIPLLVTRASGETIGVLEVGPATLGPHGVATVVTPIVVTSTGTYTLELDRQESIVDAVRSNNSVTRLLVAGGG